MIGREMLVFIKQQIHLAYRHLLLRGFCLRSSRRLCTAVERGQDRSTEFNNKSALRDAAGLGHLGWNVVLLDADASWIFASSSYHAW